MPSAEPAIVGNIADSGSSSVRLFSLSSSTLIFLERDDAASAQRRPKRMSSTLMEVTRAAHNGTGKKAEVCKVKKSKRGSSPCGRMYLHLTASRLKVDFEFSTYNERIAILGMSAAAEGFDDREEVITYPAPKIMLI
ncbi:hypothetical protein NL676_025873 [Syzygium grande]|nr:hypothetical protein NL676_025873 [Syzygium grande]